VDHSQNHKETFQQRINSVPLSSEYGTDRTVKARFWPWLLDQSPQNLSSCLPFARKRIASGWPRGRVVKAAAPIATIGRSGVRFRVEGVSKLASGWRTAPCIRAHGVAVRGVHLGFRVWGEGLGVMVSPISSHIFTYSSTNLKQHLSFTDALFFFTFSWQARRGGPWWRGCCRLATLSWR